MAKEVEEGVGGALGTNYNQISLVVREVVQRDTAIRVVTIETNAFVA